MTRRADSERLPHGEIRLSRDPKGRLTGARYVERGKNRGWILALDPAAGTGTFTSPDRMGQYRWHGGRAVLYTAWSDGEASTDEVELDEWIEGCLADLRDTGYAHVARAATRALDRKELAEAARLFRAFESYARARPDAFNAAALARFRTSAALVKVARGSGRAEAAVSEALASVFAGEDRSEKESAALGRRLRRVLGARRTRSVLAAAVARALAALEGGWPGVGEAERWRQLQALRACIARVAGDDGVAALAEAAAAHPTDDRNVARFAQVLASRTGQVKLLADVSQRLAARGDASIADLNNKASTLTVASRYREAEAIFAEVETRLAAGPGDDERQAMLDEYFHRTNLAVLRWKQERYHEALAPAERAYHLERRIADHHAFDDPFSGADKTYAGSAMFNNGLWDVISAYTGLEQFDEAERIFETELGDPNRLAARHAANEESLENAMNAGLCIYTERKTPEKMARGRRLFDLLCERIPVPKRKTLTWGYACAYGYYGQEEKAREFVQRALDKGVSKAELHDDPDFDPVRDRPWFKQLVG